MKSESVDTISSSNPLTQWRNFLFVRRLAETARGRCRLPSFLGAFQNHRVGIIRLSITVSPRKSGARESKPFLAILALRVRLGNEDKHGSVWSKIARLIQADMLAIVMANGL